MTEEERVAQILGMKTYGNQEAVEIKARAIRTGKAPGATAIEILNAIGDEVELQSLINYAVSAMKKNRRYSH